MKVAIIGAGIAGLACAFEFERLGVEPIVYEKNNYIGEAYSHVASPLAATHKPIRDSIRYYEKLGIEIVPLNTIHRVIHNSPGKKAELKGNFGYFFMRDKSKSDIKQQIYSQLKKTQVILNESADYKKLSEKYDYVIVATGNSKCAEELGCWQQYESAYCKIAVAEGSFDPRALIMWFNINYSRNGYVYLGPFNDKKASISMVVNNSNEKEVDKLWDIFIETENITYKLSDFYKYPHTLGKVYPHTVGNIYLVGNAGGGIDPFLGFGQLNAIIMGVMAARSIVYGKDYEKLIKRVVKSNAQKFEFRKYINRASNEDYNKIVSFTSLPLVKQLIYDSPVDFIKYGSCLLRLFGNRNKR